MKLPLALVLLAVCFSCSRKPKDNLDASQTENRQKIVPNIINKPDSLVIPKDMIWVPGGVFRQGAVNEDALAMSHEKPAHEVVLDGFFMDVHEVTNAQFAQFVEETGYVTLAEREVDWEEMKKQLPINTPKPDDTLLQPGSLVFKKNVTSISNLNDYSQWWDWTTGAN